MTFHDIFGKRHFSWLISRFSWLFLTFHTRGHPAWMELHIRQILLKTLCTFSLSVDIQKKIVPPSILRLKNINITFHNHLRWSQTYVGICFLYFLYIISHSYQFSFNIIKLFSWNEIIQFLLCSAYNFPKLPNTPWGKSYTHINSRIFF